MRKFKYIVAMSLAVLGVLAASASAASAAEFHTNISGASLEGVQVKEHEHKFTVEGSAVTCKTAKFTGKTTGLTALTQKMTPTYGNCTAFGFAEASVETNGCEYEFQSNGGTVNVLCPTGKVIEINVESLFGTHCHVNVAAQNGVNGQSYENNTGHTKMTVKTASNNIHYEVTKSAGLCPLTEGAKGTNAEYSGWTGVEANAGAAQIWWE